jgi:predicted Zn finger-like uncharacterized protein
MLLTRCPGCRTTFRVTREALEVAEGQVRCGRCSTIFDARDELSEEPTVATPMISPAPVEHDDGRRVGDTDMTSASTDDAAEDPLARTDEYFIPEGAFDSLTPDSKDEDADRQESASEDADIAAPIPGFADEAAVSDMIAELRRQQSLAEDSADAFPEGDTPGRQTTGTGLYPIAEGRGDAIGPEQVDAVLGSAAERAGAPAAAPWAPKRSTQSPPSRWWAVAAAVAVVALAVQLLHHYRSELATHPVIGTWLSDGYSQLGLQVVPSWDLDQYRIMDWVASAETDEQVQSSLNITARIQNQGPNAQPFPHVKLELKDRWDAPVGSRIFQPHEYMETAATETMMQPGQTARAQLRVLDPGADAYGFQLDVCIPAPQGALRCAMDDVFR